MIRQKKTNKQSDKISEKKLDNKIGPKNRAEKKNTRTKKTDKKIGEQHRTEKSDKQAADEKTKENLKVCLITTTVLPNTYP